MRNIATLFLFCPILIFCQIGPASLSVGTSEVLFEKGKLDTELLGEIISEKQYELKKELAKRLILNKKLSKGPYLTYHYADQTLETLLDHKKKGIIKKNLLENAAELAIVIGIAEAYMNIKKETVLELERRYLLFSTDENLFNEHIGIPRLQEGTIISDCFAIQKLYEHAKDSDRSLSSFFPNRHSNRKHNNRKSLSNYSSSEVSTKKQGNYLSKVSKLYRLKNLGYVKIPDWKLKGLETIFTPERIKSEFPKGSFHQAKTHLHYILLDMFYEICRNNESLQRLGFFQKKFDQTTFENRSHFGIFSELENIKKFSNNLNYKHLKAGLDDIFEQASKMISVNLEFANIILNQPVESSLIDSVFTENEKLSELKTVKKLDSIITKLELNKVKAQFNSSEYKEKFNTYIYSVNDEQTNDDNLDDKTLAKQFLTGEVKSIVDTIYYKEASNRMDKLFSQSLKLQVPTSSQRYFSTSDKEALKELSEVVYAGVQLFRQKSSTSDKTVWILATKKLIPKLISMNSRIAHVDSKKTLDSIVTKLDTIEQLISLGQLEEIKFKIGEIKNIRRLDEIDKDIESNSFVQGEGIRTEMAEIFQVLTNLDQSRAHDQISKIIIDIGDIFFELSDSRVMDELSNLQSYLTIDSENNKVDINVEDMILYLGDKYINNISSPLSLYFSVGFNYGEFHSYDPENDQFARDVIPLNFASEKIGLKLKLYDFVKWRGIESRYYNQKPKSFVKDIYALGYGSGLLYQVEALKSENSISGTSFGLGIGARFLNDLDLNMTWSSIKLDSQKGDFWGVGLDIPISEYLGRLSAKRKNAKQED